MFCAEVNKLLVMFTLTTRFIYIICNDFVKNSSQVMILFNSYSIWYTFWNPIPFKYNYQLNIGSIQVCNFYLMDLLESLASSSSKM